MKHSLLKRGLSLVLCLLMMVTMIPFTASAASIDTAYLSDMLERAEAIVNYKWVPTRDFSTWRGNTYNGRSYFKSGETVIGMPYTLFGQYTLDAYKKVESKNYTKTGNCSGYGMRTGPAYGTCCASFVCEVLGGSFLPNGKIYSYNVSGIRNSKSAKQLKNVKANELLPGDAVSISGHVIWISEINDTSIIIYEAAPPVTRKVILSKEKCINKNGYFIYDGETYSTVTRVNVIRDTSSFVSKATTKISANVIPVPITKSKGTPYEFFSGSISANNGIAYTAAFVSDSNGTIVKANVKSFSGSGNPVSITAADAFNSLIDFSTLSSGEYALTLYATCKFKSGNGLFGWISDLFSIPENFLKIYSGKFTVPGSSRSTYNATSRSASSRRTGTDKYGNTYYLYSTNLTEDSQYDKNSSYSIGTYKIIARSGLNTRSKPSATSSKLSGWSYGDVVNVTATDGNWGYTSRGWICLDYTSFVSGAVSSYDSNVSYGVGNYVVATPSGLNCRRGVGTNYSVIKTLKNGTQFSVTETDGAWGYSPEHGGWLCLQYASYVSALTPSLPVPALPNLSTTTSSEIGVGEVISFKWDAVDTADIYNVKLIDANTNKEVQSTTVTGTNASFKTPYAGKFNVSVSASNSQHDGPAAILYGFTAKAPSTVTFKDWDGKVISTQEVAYGKDATAPTAPSRVGYTFSKWDGDFNAVREDRTITATYTRNKYKVTFCDYDGTVIGTQDVYYGDAATAPAYSAPTGYSFVKWDTDFDNITKATTVKAVISWTSLYPLEISTSSAVQRNNKSYIVTSIVNNSPKTVSNAKIIAVLKTKENKLLATVQSENISLAKGEVKNLTLTASYEGMATKAEIFVVKADNENIPLAKQLTKDVDQGTAWSAWSTSAPPADALQVESRTEYRYRDKQFTTSTSSTLSGWTLRSDITNPTVTYGNWGGWSAWQDSAISETDVCDVDTQQVTVSQGYTQYRYSRLKSTSTTHNTFCPHAQRSGQTYVREYTAWSTTRIPTSDWWECSICGMFYTYATQDNDPNGYHWYYTEESQWVDTSYTKTQYRYRTRSKTTTYNFYKWGDWSAWSTNGVSANSDKEVETRTVYRYLANTANNIETTAGVFVERNGVVDKSYAGRQALLFVIDKNGTSQFVGQTVIGTDGSYAFNFKTKDEPTVTSGDYTVMLSIEGTSAAFELEPIKAPVPEYKVKFVDYDGTVVSEQTVKQGEDASVPAPLSREGYRFIGWDKSFTNIQSNTTLTAQYEIKTFDVVFVDEINDTSSTVKYNYGDKLVPPEVTLNDAYSFLGWDAVINGTTKVKENMVVTAKFEKKMFTVDFLDFDGSLLESQTIEYGEPAIIPELENRDNYVFISWIIPGDTTYVTESMTVEPYYEYTETVATPTASIETGTYNGVQTVTLSCETAGAQIYYTTDGTDPLEEVTNTKARSVQLNGTLYTGPFKLDSSSQLMFTAVKDGMNSSDYDYKTLAINTADTTAKQYTVTIHDSIYDFGYTILVNDGNKVVLGEDTENYGYTLAGVYTDAAYTNAWDLEKDIVKGELDLYYKWTKDTYTVTFEDMNGDVIETQTVEFGDSAVAPQWPEIENYIFTGWNADYSNIYEDTVVFATYVHVDDITTVEFEYETLKLIEGDTHTIEATVDLGYGCENDALIWQSSNEDVVIVDDNGKITAIAAGAATIFAVSEDSGMSAQCEVTVESEDPCSVLGHSEEVIPGKAATCTETGLTEGKKCSVCGEVLVAQAVIDKTSHKPTMVGEKAATATQDGYTGDTVCATCGMMIEEGKVIPATGDSSGSSRCDHLCHKDGILGFFWKILRLFFKLFQINPVCECGAAHY